MIIVRTSVGVILQLQAITEWYCFGIMGIDKLRSVYLQHILVQYTSNEELLILLVTERVYGNVMVVFNNYHE